MAEVYSCYRNPVSPELGTGTAEVEIDQTRGGQRVIADKLGLEPSGRLGSI